MAVIFDNKVDPVVLASSIDDLTNDQPVTIRTIRKVAWRLAANFKALQRGISQPSGVTAFAPYHAHGIISAVAIDLIDTPRGKQHQLKIGVRILSGKKAGALAVAVFSSKFGPVLFRSLAKLPRKTSYTTPNLMSGFKVYVEIADVKGVLTCKTVQVTSSQLTFNSNLTKKRFREHSPCLFGKPFDCYRCSFGRDLCKLAMRLNTLRTTNESTDKPAGTTESPVQQRDDDQAPGP